MNCLNYQSILFEFRRIISSFQVYSVYKTKIIMSLYSFAVFIHVTGAIMLGFIIGIEWMMVFRLRNAENRDEALSALGIVKIIGKMSPITWLTILIPGFYMITKAWGWAAWIDTAIAGWLVLFISGALIAGKKLTRLAKELEASSTLEPSIQKKLADKSILVGLRLRTSITLAIIFMMTVKPVLQISVIVLILSFAGALIPIGRRKRVEAAETI